MIVHARTERRKHDPVAGNRPAPSAKTSPAWRRPALRSALGLVLLLGIPLAGQNPSSPFGSGGNSRSGQRFPSANDPGDQNPTPKDQKRIQMLNAQRQKEIVSETQKLLQLARELNDEVAAADSEHMSDDQMHKVAEIGKLAKSVKDKMTYSVLGYPSLNTPLTLPPGVE